MVVHNVGKSKDYGNFQLFRLSLLDSACTVCKRKFVIYLYDGSERVVFYYIYLLYYIHGENSFLLPILT